MRVLLRAAAWALPGLSAPGIMMVGVQLAETTAIGRGTLLAGGLAAFGLLWIACGCIDTVLKLTNDGGPGRLTAVRFARRFGEFTAFQLVLIPFLAILEAQIFLGLASI